MATQGEGEPHATSEGHPPIPVQAILESEIHSGLRELHRPPRGILLAGFSAGMDVGFGPLLMGVILTVGATLGPIWQRLLVANAYAVGFVLVVLGRSELFTEHTTMAAVPVLDRQASVLRMLRVWALIFFSNVLGTALFSAIAALTATSLGIVTPHVFAEIALKLVGHPWWVIALSAVLAGWLMGLLSWLLRTSQETIGQIAIVWIITASIGLAQLHHCIAGSAEVLLGVFATGFRTVGLDDYAHFLLWATLGNIVGGVVFVALVKVGHARQPSHTDNP